MIEGRWVERLPHIGLGEADADVEGLHTCSLPGELQHHDEAREKAGVSARDLAQNG